MTRLRLGQRPLYTPPPITGRQAGEHSPAVEAEEEHPQVERSNREPSGDRPSNRRTTWSLSGPRAKEPRLTQVPVQAQDQLPPWVSLPHPSPGVQEARDAVRPTPQTPRKKDPAYRGNASEGGSPEAPPRSPCPEATNPLLTGPHGQSFLLQDGSGGVALTRPASSLLPVYTDASAAGPTIV